MTDRAVLRKTGEDVIRILRVVEIRQMAGRTSCRQSFVLTIFVAVRTLPRSVATRQRELRFAVVKGSRRPCGHIVAAGAVLGKARGRVIRILRAVEVCQMTGHTGRRQAGVLAIFMAVCALPGSMGAGQRKFCLAVVE